MSCYHEKQVLYQCGRHTVNNILQRNEFQWGDFERIARQLVSEDSTRHSNPLGLGNYDANVLMIALRMHGLELEWFDCRKPLDDFNIDSSNCIAIVINWKEQYSVIMKALGMDTNHWFTIRKLRMGKWISSSLDERLSFHALTSHTSPQFLLRPSK
jgi:josephin